MAKIVLIIGGVVELGRGLGCYLISRKLVNILGIWYIRPTVVPYYCLGAALLVFGLMFIMASNDSTRHKFIINMGIFYFGLRFVSYFLMLARLGSLDIFWWIMAIVDLVLFILFFISRQKLVPQEDK
jgi:hypothetical protein